MENSAKSVMFHVEQSSVRPVSPNVSRGTHTTGPTLAVPVNSLPGYRQISPFCPEIPGATPGFARTITRCRSSTDASFPGKSTIVATIFGRTTELRASLSTAIGATFLSLPTLLAAPDIPPAI